MCRSSLAEVIPNGGVQASDSPKIHGSRREVTEGGGARGCERMLPRGRDKRARTRTNEGQLFSGSTERAEFPQKRTRSSDRERVVFERLPRVGNNV